MGKKKLAKSRFALWALVALVTCLIAAVGHDYLSAFNFIYHQDQSRPVDAIVVIGGLPGPRSDVAARLFREDFARRIFVSGKGDGATIHARLKQLGVPENAITLEPKSATTFQNAQFMAPHFRKYGIRNAIIVTSWFHTRRALRCFQSEAPNVAFLVVSGPRPKAPNRYERNRARTEYWKLLFYWFRYGIVP